MNLRAAAVAVLLLPFLASCSRKDDAPPAPAASPAAAPAPEPAPPPAATPSPAEGATATPSAPTAQAAAPTAATPTPGLVEGRDYASIPNGQPLVATTGQVEIAEFFNYACPACNAFNPHLLAWKKTLPAYARLVYVPMDFRPDFVQYAHAYYAAESLGLVEKSHEAVFAAIHDTHALPGEGAVQDAATIAKFYAQFGAEPADFQGRMDSFAVDSLTRRARQFAVRSQVTGTPSLVIDGRYLVKGASWDDALRIAGLLVEKEHGG